MALTPEEIITAFGEMTDAQKKALKSAIGAESSVPSGKKLDEQIAKLAQYKKALDQIKDIDADTMYFVISTLNQLNIDPLRNKLILKVLSLKV